MPTNPSYTVAHYEEARRIVNKRAAASGDAYSLDLQLAKDIAISLTTAREEADKLKKALECWVDHQGQSCFWDGNSGWCGECARCVTRKALGLPLTKDAL